MQTPATPPDEQAAQDLQRINAAMRNVQDPSVSYADVMPRTPLDRPRPDLPREAAAAVDRYLDAANDVDRVPDHAERDRLHRECFREFRYGLHVALRRSGGRRAARVRAPRRTMRRSGRPGARRPAATRAGPSSDDGPGEPEPHDLTGAGAAR